MERVQAHTGQNCEIETGIIFRGKMVKHIPLFNTVYKPIYIVRGKCGFR